MVKEMKRNKVEVKDGVAYIHLQGKNGDGKVTLVDYDDYIRLDLGSYRWMATKDGYAAAHDRVNNRKNLRLHRLILGLTDSKIWGDHIDKALEGFDNRKSNLRPVTAAQNTYNRRKNKTQKYKGVSLKYGKHRAQTRINKKKAHMGLWETPELAAYSYDITVKQVFKEFANLNNVDHLLTDEEKTMVDEYVAGVLAEKGIKQGKKLYMSDSAKFHNKDLHSKQDKNNK